MKKGKYIDIYVIMACLSRKKSKINLQGIDELLNKACAGCHTEDCKEECHQQAVVTETETYN